MGKKTGHQGAWSSDATAFFNAVRQAKKCVESNVTGEIESYVSNIAAAGKE